MSGILGGQVGLLMMANEFANQRIYFSELRLRFQYKCYVGNQLKC